MQQDRNGSGFRSMNGSSEGRAPGRAGVLSFTECRIQRTALGWSLADLSSRSGFSVSTISEFEEGRRPLREAALVALQRALRKGFSSVKGRPKS
jgi:DNA-binding transcriptional regulator YiaG